MLRALAFAAALACSGCVARQTVVESSELTGPAVASGVWVREELFLGRNIPDGGVVSDSAFAHFVDAEVVTKLPSGFTLYDATGLYRSTSGTAVRESTKVLVVLYRAEDRVSSHAVEELIASYKRQFRQESVLRVTQRVRAEF